MATDTVQLDGLEQFDDYFEQMADNFNVDADYEGLLGLFLLEMEEHHAQWFAGQHAPGGSSWPALAPATVKRKGHSTILVDTGRLKQSFQGGSDAFRKIIGEGLNHGLSYGTMVPYSIYHQDGMGHLPQREHVGINNEILSDMTERVADRTVAIVLED